MPWVEILEPRRLFAQPVQSVVVDLLTVYDTNAKNFHGGTVNVETAIRRAVDATNDAFDNSGIAVTIRLVRMEEIAYSSSGDLSTDRERLRQTADGYMDSAHTTRNTWGADLVALITHHPSVGGGNANLLVDLDDPQNPTLAFTAIAANSIGGANLTLAHELGHLLGFGHEDGNPSQPAVGPFPYSVGYRFIADDGNTYHDIMSYDPGINTPYFANPAILYKGVPTGSAVGNADEADLAKTAEFTAPIVAAYRGTVVSDTLPPTASISEIQRSGDLLLITVEYRDNRAIDLSTIDSDDFTVTTPEGFVLTAGLESLKNSGIGGGVKEATYRAMVPANHPEVSALTFSLKPGAVSDHSGLYTAAGALARTPARTAAWGYASSRDFGALVDRVSTGGSLGYYENDHTYRFTLDSAATLSVKMTNLLADANVMLVRDVDGNGVYNGGTDFQLGSFRTGTSDDSFTTNLTAGEYFIWVFNVTQQTTNQYQLSIQRYEDTTAPVAMLDAPDIRTTGNTQFVFRVGFKDDREMNAESVRYSAPVRVTNQWGGWWVYFPESIDADVDGPMRWATYRINTGTIDSGWNGPYTVALEPPDSSVWGANPLTNYPKDGAGNWITPTMLGTFHVAVGQGDTTVPTATAVTPNVVVGKATTYDFTVSYQDNVSINVTTIGNSDVRVTGPGGFNVAATLVSVTPAPAVGTLRTATYRITPPGGFWNVDDNGSYSVVMQASQVGDASGNSVAAGMLAAFNVHVHLDGDTTANDKVDTVDFNVFAGNYSKRGRGFYEGDFSYDGIVDSIDFNLLVGNHGRSIPSAAAPLFPAPGQSASAGPDDEPDADLTIRETEAEAAA